MSFCFKHSIKHFLTFYTPMFVPCSTCFDYQTLGPSLNLSVKIVVVKISSTIANPTIIVLINMQLIVREKYYRGPSTRWEHLYLFHYLDCERSTRLAPTFPYLSLRKLNKKPHFFSKKSQLARISSEEKRTCSMQTINVAQMHFLH